MGRMVEIRNYFLIPTIISIGMILLIFIYRRSLFRSNKILWNSILIRVIIYLFFVGSSLIEDTYYNYKVNSFTNNEETYQVGDLNHEQLYYLERLTNDSGRNISVFFGLFIAILVGFLYFIIAKAIKFLRN